MGEVQASAHHEVVITGTGVVVAANHGAPGDPSLPAGAVVMPDLVVSVSGSDPDSISQRTVTSSEGEALQ